MKKMLWTLFLLWGSSAVKGLQENQGGHMELTRLKVSLLYVRSIKTLRLLFMSLLGMGICLVFLLVGLVLLYVSLFMYSPWSMETKMLVGLLSSAIYLLATLAIFSKIFAADKWLAIFHADGIADRLNRSAVSVHNQNKEPIE